jgi:hypothetical protein
MTYDIYSIDLPAKEDMSLEQINLLENYEHIYKEFKKTPGSKDLSIAALKTLSQFFDIFPKELKDKYQYWYKFQITLIDPLIGPVTKISELITECNLQEKIAITDDGKSILVPIDEKDFASAKFLKLLDKELPGLKHRKIKI